MSDKEHPVLSNGSYIRVELSGSEQCHPAPFDLLNLRCRDVVVTDVGLSAERLVAHATSPLSRTYLVCRATVVGRRRI